MFRTKVALTSLILVFLLAACNLIMGAPPESTVDTDALVAQALAQTQLVQTQDSLAAQLTLAASGGGAPPPPVALPTYTYQPTYTFQYTNTLSTITVTVSISTNCRTGPGSAYPIVGALGVGQVAEVVGRSAASDNWIVKLPGQTATCWLWGQYATVTGNTSGLPIINPPPPPITPTWTTASYINLTLKNNTAVSICYVFIALPEEPTWGSNELPIPIPPGGSYTWLYQPGIYDIEVEDCIPNWLKTFEDVSMFSNTVLAVP